MRKLTVMVLILFLLPTALAAQFDLETITGPGATISCSHGGRECRCSNERGPQTQPPSYPPDPEWVTFWDGQLRKVAGVKDEHNLWVESLRDGKGLTGWVSGRYVARSAMPPLIIASALNMRSQPGNTSGTAAALPRGTQVDILAEENGWLQVRVRSGKVFVHRSRAVPSSGTDAPPPTDAPGEDIPLRDALLANGQTRPILRFKGKNNECAIFDARGLEGWIGQNYVRRDGERSRTACWVALHNKTFSGDDMPPDNGIAMLEKGTPLTVLGNQGKWLRVRVDGGSGQDEVQAIRRRLAAGKVSPPVKPPVPPVVPDDPGKRPGSEPPAETTDPHDALDESAERARAALLTDRFDETGQDDAAITTVLEGILSGSEDPEEIAARLKAEEEETLTSGSGDGLKVMDVSGPTDKVTAGSTVQVRARVKNTAKEGTAAVFDLGVSDGYGDGSALDRKRGLRLAPGEESTWTLTLTAPREFNFSGWVWVEPRSFAGGELPALPLSFSVLWDGSSMTDAEILTDLRSRIPDARYTIPGSEEWSWIARYRASPADAQGAIVAEALRFIRELERAETEAWLNDPARLAARAADEAAEAESAKLREFLALETWARNQATLQGIDLPGLLEDMVYVDDQAHVQGDLAAARVKLNRAIAEKNAGAGAADSARRDWLLGEVNGKKLSTSDFHSRNETTLGATAAGTTLLTGGGAFTDAAGKKLLAEVMTDYNNLLAAHRAAGTRPERFARDLEAVSTRLKALKNQVHFTVGKGREALGKMVDAVEKELDGFRQVMREGKAFQARTDQRLAEKKGFKRLEKSMGFLGDAISLYDAKKKTEARIRAGEDETTAISRESLKWNVKKVMTKNPVVATADALLTFGGSALYAARRGHYEQQEGDPRQYNASYLVDLGVDGSIALLDDASRNLGRRMEGKVPLTDTDRQRLRERLKSLETHLNGTKDPVIRERLLTARRYVREQLDGR